MQVRVSTEVEPGVFDEAVIGRLGGTVVRHVHKGWLSVEVDPAQIDDLNRQQGVLGTLAVLACEDRLDQLPEDTKWETLAEADAHGLVAFTLESGSAGGRIVALRLTSVAKELCFVRSHLTSALDIVLRRRGAAGEDAAPEQDAGAVSAAAAGVAALPAASPDGAIRATFVPPGPVAARHSAGLRDGSIAGSHDWKPGTTRTIALWIGHLPDGAYDAESGFVGGAIRVKTRLEPFTFHTEVQLG